jgi:hypothetical protein
VNNFSDIQDSNNDVTNTPFLSNIQSRSPIPTIDPKLLIPTPIRPTNQLPQMTFGNNSQNTKPLTQITSSTTPTLSNPKEPAPKPTNALKQQSEIIKEIIKSRYQSPQQIKVNQPETIKNAIELTVEGLPRLSACKKMSGDYCDFCKMYIAFRKGDGKDPKKACRFLSTGKSSAPYPDKQTVAIMKRNNNLLKKPRNQPSIPVNEEKGTPAPSASNNTIGVTNKESVNLNK